MLTQFVKNAVGKTKSAGGKSKRVQPDAFATSPRVNALETILGASAAAKRAQLTLIWAVLPDMAYTRAGKCHIGHLAAPAAVDSATLQEFHKNNGPVDDEFFKIFARSNLVCFVRRVNRQLFKAKERYAMQQQAKTKKRFGLVLLDNELQNKFEFCTGKFVGMSFKNKPPKPIIGFGNNLLEAKFNASKPFDFHPLRDIEIVYGFNFSDDFEVKKLKEKK